MFMRHHLYRKIRGVFPYGERGDVKVRAVDEALDIEQDPRGHAPHLKHPLEEDEVEDKLSRLSKRGFISEQESARVQEILDADMHPDSK